MIPKRGSQRRTILWTNRASLDLETIGDYIARDNPNAAAKWVARLVTAAEHAVSAPLAGRRVPELGRDEIREVLLRTYRIVYRVTANSLEVLTIFEGHRLLRTDVAFPQNED